MVHRRSHHAPGRTAVIDVNHFPRREVTQTELLDPPLAMQSLNAVESAVDLGVDVRSVQVVQVKASMPRLSSDLLHWYTTDSAERFLNRACFLWALDAIDRDAFKPGWLRRIRPIVSSVLPPWYTMAVSTNALLTVVLCRPEYPGKTCDQTLQYRYSRNFRTRNHRDHSNSFCRISGWYRTRCKRNW